MYEIVVKTLESSFIYLEFIEFGDLTQVINFIQLYEHHSKTVCSYTITFQK